MSCAFKFRLCIVHCQWVPIHGENRLPNSFPDSSKDDATAMLKFISPFDSTSLILNANEIMMVQLTSLFVTSSQCAENYSKYLKVTVYGDDRER